MKMKKRVLSVVLAAVMAFSLAACGSGEEAAETEATEAAAEAADGEEAAAPERARLAGGASSVASLTRAVYEEEKGSSWTRRGVVYRFWSKMPLHRKRRRGRACGAHLRTWSWSWCSSV